MEVVKETVECAFHINIKNKKTCLEDEIITELQKFAKNIKQMNTSNYDVVDKLQKIYDCKSESCLLTKDEIRANIGESIIENQLENRYKPNGPYNSNKWFSNNNIDKVLKQIEKKYKNKKFLHIEFQMRDFEKTNGSLSKIDMVQEYKKGMRCFGVIFNTDFSSGNGEHWFAIFGDLSKTPITIEYFNSSGEDPLPEIAKWMKDTKHKLEKELKKSATDVIVTKLINQKDNHSCGSYSLYYIISRLAGVPFEYFTNNIIGDKKMHEFRYHLFRKS
jgi:hypothetical protein